jgi:hypothetical protein
MADDDRFWPRGGVPGHNWGGISAGFIDQNGISGYDVDPFDFRVRQYYMSPNAWTMLGPQNVFPADERIADEACDRLTEHGWIDARDVELVVERGEVTLLGTVDSRWAKRAVEETVDLIPGVRDVDNDLRIRPRNGAGGDSSDVPGTD